MTDLTTAPPCPICRSTELRRLSCVRDVSRCVSRYSVIECERCGCSAPASVWMNRLEIQNGVDIRFFHPMQVEGVA